MIYLELFIGFLKVGLFSFGGAYAAIPLIRDVVLSYGWLDDSQLSNMIAISESTPGPIMINTATYIGSSQAGLLGAIIATITVALPAFVVIILVLAVLKYALKNKYVKEFFSGLKSGVIGIILATGIVFFVSSVINVDGLELSLDSFGTTVVKVFNNIEWKALIIALVLYVLYFAYKYIRKKNISPIVLIIVSAVCGIFIL